MHTGIANLPRAAQSSCGAPARAEVTTKLASMALEKLRWYHYDFWGLAVAIIFGAVSFTPSLLPREPALQGLIAGLTAVTGYVIGTAAHWLFRQFTSWQPARRTQKFAWTILIGLGVVAGVLMLTWGAIWQRDLHISMGIPPPDHSTSPAIFIFTGTVFVALVGIARLFRLLIRFTARLIRKLVPRRIARPISLVLVSVLLYGAIDGILFRYIGESVNQTFSLADIGTDPGASQPRTPARSGSSQSLISWDSLGRTGRNFVSAGPTQVQLTGFSGSIPADPIRAYAGLDSAESTRERARLAVADLERAGGFERSAIVVNTTTGTGWVNESSASAVEYIFNGDIAQIGIQYSYLPSWISYLADQEKAVAAGQELFEAVYEVWQELPAGSRPKLYVFGESLGSYGSEAAFSSLADVTHRTDGALWVGPPSFNALHTRLVTEREPGTPQWRPIVDDGTTVRFITSPADLDRPSGKWDHPRVIYLQHASDPIVWWSPDLLTRRPDWLAEQAADGVSEMTWIPGVTFWQITADLPFAIEVPDGYGHNYGAELADMWVALVDPPNWSHADTARLRDAVAGLAR